MASPEERESQPDRVHIEEYSLKNILFFSRIDQAGMFSPCLVNIYQKSSNRHRKGGAGQGSTWNAPAEAATILLRLLSLGMTASTVYTGFSGSVVILSGIASS